MFKPKKIHLMTLIAFAVTGAAPAFAAGGTSLGLIGGYAIPVSAGGAGSLTYGVGGAVKFNPEWEAGLRAFS